MALIKTDSGNKVGWATYDNEQEARDRAERAVPLRNKMLQNGYDFGYSWPGTVERRMKSRYDAQGNFDPTIPVEYLDEWTVVTP